MSITHTRLAADNEVEAAWAGYLDRTAQLSHEYDTAIDAALTQLGRASQSAYADYDKAAELAWDAWKAGTAQARLDRDHAVDAAIAEAEHDTDRAIAQMAGEA